MEEWITKIWSFIGFFTLLQNILPQQIHQILMKWLSSLQDYFNAPYYHLEIPEFKDNHGFNGNVLYENVEHYLNTLDGIVRARRLTVFCGRNSSNLGLCPAYDEVVEDSFRGAKVWWSHNAQSQQRSREGDAMDDKRCFTLKVAQADKELLSAYFTHIKNGAAEFSALNNELTLYTNAGDARWGDGWSGVPFKHSSTFASLALDPLLKADILSDLDRFKRGREFYRRIGRSWKRGYLLHGPPGTGKTSLVAAIANHMKYDVYDLDLTRVVDNADLRALLTQTKEKSVIVIEDIDCSLNLTDRVANPSQGDEEDQNRSKVTLSGMLNFTDGLWSCCGEERIIVFTTNHKDKLDPALLRCGRMDKHILLSFCTFPAFKSLAFNYLQIEDHALFPAVAEQFESGAEMTSAEIIEILMNKVEDPCEEALYAVIRALDAKKKEKEALPPSQSAHTEGEERQSRSLKNSQKQHSRKKQGRGRGTRR